MTSTNALAAYFWGKVEVYRITAGALVLLAPLVSFWLSTVTSGLAVTLILVVQLVVAVATWGIGEGRARTLEGERLESRQETLVVVGDLLDPVMLELARVSVLSKVERRAQRSGLINLLLAAATGLSDAGTRSRACYFKLETAASGKRALIHQLSVGRSLPAKASFEQGTVAGDTALSMVDGNEVLFCDDVVENPPPGWTPSQRGEYNTFISVSACSGNVPYGMLTLDAQPAGALTAEDVAMMRVFGHTLAVIETITA